MTISVRRLPLPLSNQLSWVKSPEYECSVDHSFNQHRIRISGPASSVLTDDFSNAPVISLISDDTNLHFQIMQLWYRWWLTSSKVLHSLSIPEAVSDISMIQCLAFWYGSNTGRSVCSFIASNARKIEKKDECDAANCWPLHWLQQ